MATCTESDNANVTSDAYPTTNVDETDDDQEDDNLSCLENEIINEANSSTDLKIHLRIEDHEYLKNLICPGDFTATIDLSNVFFSIPLHKDGKKFCSFEF